MGNFTKQNKNKKSSTFILLVEENSQATFALKSDFVRDVYPDHG